MLAYNVQRRRLQQSGRGLALILLLYSFDNIILILFSKTFSMVAKVVVMESAGLWTLLLLKPRS